MFLFLIYNSTQHVGHYNLQCFIFPLLVNLRFWASMRPNQWAPVSDILEGSHHLHLSPQFLLLLLPGSKKEEENGKVEVERSGEWCYCMKMF